MGRTPACSAPGDKMETSPQRNTPTPTPTHDTQTNKKDSRSDSVSERKKHGETRKKKKVSPAVFRYVGAVCILMFNLNGAYRVRYQVYNLPSGNVQLKARMLQPQHQQDFDFSSVFSWRREVEVHRENKQIKQAFQLVKWSSIPPSTQRKQNGVGWLIERGTIYRRRPNGNN